MRVVDDRLGVVIELPSVQTVVGPGESICNTDIGNIASYTVQPDDAGSVIHNNAVVTVRTQEAEPREFQGTATVGGRRGPAEGSARARRGTSESVTARALASSSIR